MRKFMGLEKLVVGLAILSFGSLGLATEFKQECTGGDLFLLSFSYSDNDGANKIVNAVVSVGNNDHPAVAIARNSSINSQPVRPGVPELADLAGAAIVEFVFDERSFTSEGRRLLESVQMNDMSIVAMKSDSAGSPLANFALVMGVHDASGNREGRLLSLYCR